MQNADNSAMLDKNNCIPYETVIMPDSLAKAYVPMQKICSYFEPAQGLVNGTIFPGLYKPFSYQEA